MPEAFERFFFKVMRKPGQSLLEFCTDFNQALRELLKFKIDLPQEVSGWLMLRRAALIREQQVMVQTHIGTKLTLSTVEVLLGVINSLIGGIGCLLLQLKQFLQMTRCSGN